MVSIEQPLRHSEAVFGSDPATEPGDSTATRTLNTTLMWYPLALLLVFFTTNVVYSILTAQKEEEESATISEARGPGGKPLPITKQRRRTSADRDRECDRDVWGPILSPTSQGVFRWVSVLLLLTFCANGAAHFAHLVEVWPAKELGEDVWKETEEMSVSDPHPDYLLVPQCFPD